jgi:hypothetical protein
MKALDFSLATTEEIIKELAQRAKQKRKKNMHHYGNQKSFANHIGMSYRSYQQFEISGKITLEKFIDVLRGLDALEEVQVLLMPSEDDLFNRIETKPLQSLKNKREINELDEEDMVKIPNVFE